MVTQSLQQQLDLEVNQQVIESHTEENLENGEEYARLTKTPYQNLMLDRRVLRTEERPMGHKLFLPQEVVRQEVWTGGFQRRHSSIRRSPRREMQLTTHSNE
jgi:hypothetical protein